MSWVGIEADLQELTKGLTRVQRAALDLRPVWHELRGPLRKDMAQHIRQQVDESGAAWPGLAPATVKKRLDALRRTRPPGKLVTKKGRLRKAVQRRINRVLSARMVSRAKIRTEPGEMSITSEVPWAGVHQFGGAVGRGSRLPKRTFMYVSDAMAATAAMAIELHLQRVFEDRKI